MAGRGGRGALLEALLAQQRRPGAQILNEANDDQVRMQSISVEQRRGG
jgi:hypothetical protein